MPSRLDLSSGTGIFTGVHGVVTAILDIPAGYVFDGDAVLQTPLSETPVPAANTTSNGNKLIVQFNKADIETTCPRVTRCR